MITMYYPLVANDTQDSIIVLELYSVYKNEKDRCVLFRIKSGDSPHVHRVIYSNKSVVAKYNRLQYIQINDTKYNLQEIMESPYRIYTPMQQDLLKDSIEELP